VLPAVHPDTSDTPKEVFSTVFESYKLQDYLMMEAYIAHFSPAETIDEDADPLKILESLSESSKKYHRLAGRLEHRLSQLKKELTSEELENPEKVRENLQKEQKEIRKLIQIEMEKIQSIQEKFENLIQLYIDLNKGAKNGTE